MNIKIVSIYFCTESSRLKNVQAHDIFLFQKLLITLKLIFSQAKILNLRWASTIIHILIISHILIIKTKYEMKRSNVIVMGSNLAPYLFSCLWAYFRTVWFQSVSCSIRSTTCRVCAHYVRSAIIIEDKPHTRNQVDTSHWYFRMFQFLTVISWTFSNFIFVLRYLFSKVWNCDLIK